MQKIHESARAAKDSIPAGETITLVGGGFDLLHIGHLHLLRHAAKLESVLVVCVLSDANVKLRKGSERPVMGEGYRANMLAALSCVGRVYVSDLDTSHADTLSVIQPDSVVFGIEDTERRRESAKRREEFIRFHFPNIRIHYLERFSDINISTSSLVHRILNL